MSVVDMAKSKQLIIIASIFGFLAVALGAFGAHGLESALSEKAMHRYQTAVDYQFYHALALFGTGLLFRHHTNQYLRISAYALIVGILLFSGSLYAYALTGIGKLGMITPLGGLAFLVAWASLAIGVLRSK